MEFSIKSGAAAPTYSGAIVVGVFEPRTLSDAGIALDRTSRGYLSALLKHGDHDGKAGMTLLLPRVPQLNARVLLVGLGKAADFNNNGDNAFRTATQAALRALDNAGIEDATFHLPELKTRDIASQITQATLIAGDIGYRFTQMKSKPDAKRGLKRLAFHVERNQVARAQTALKRAVATVHGMTLTKDLGNLPGNVCTPTYLANQARALAKEHKLKVQVLDKRALEKLGAGSFLSVARGSVEPPYLITLEYQGAARTQKPIALVGKGITFDTGGISIKPAAEMDEMKYDMCGAASVFGTIKAIAEMKLPINVVGIIPTTENMPGGRATKPGDIVTSLSGQTIEILNTDAEGRLILCDALTYAERFEPAAVIDIATLTGACVIALGHVASGLLANDDALAQKLLEAGQTSHDRAWQLPLWEDYQPQLASNFADFANIGGRAGGTITAACFLARFTKKFKWAHLDIAGTAWKSGKEKGATGRPVPLLTQFLIERAGK